MMEVTDRMVVLRLAAEVERAGSYRALAREVGVSAAWLHQVIKHGKQPGPKVLAFLGLRPAPGYIPSRRRKAR